MNDRNLYREELLELVKNPSYKGKLIPSTIEHEGNNPMCGDRLIYQLSLDENVIRDIKYDGEACAICFASAEILSDELIGKHLTDVKYYNKEKVLELLGVNLTTSRIKCAMLPLETLQEVSKLWQKK